MIKVCHSWVKTMLPKFLLLCCFFILSSIFFPSKQNRLKEHTYNFAFSARTKILASSNCCRPPAFQSSNRAFKKEGRKTRVMNKLYTNLLTFYCKCITTIGVIFMYLHWNKKKVSIKKKNLSLFFSHRKLTCCLSSCLESSSGFERYSKTYTATKKNL